MSGLLLGTARFWVGMLLVLWSGFSSGAVYESRQSGVTVTIATFEVPPYVYASNGDAVLPRIVETAFNAVGARVAFDPIPWKRAKRAVQAGQVDGVMPSTFEDVRDLSGVGTLILETPPLMLVARKREVSKWNGHVESLRGSVVAVLRGYSYMKAFDEVRDVQKLYVDSTRQQVDMLLRGRANFALMDYRTAQYYFRDAVISNNLRVLTPPLQISSEFYLGFGGPHSERNRALFESGMAVIRDNGVLARIIASFDAGYTGEALISERPLSMKEVATTLGNLEFSGSQVQPVTLKTDTETMHLGLAGFYWNTDSYQSAYRARFLQLAKERGIKVTELDARGSVDQQIHQVRQLINEKVDVIVLWPTHASALLPVLKEARAASIPVVLTNTSIELSGLPLVRAYAGPDNFMEGRLAARMMIEGLRGKGKVLEIQGFPGYKTAAERSLGFAYELSRQRESRPEINLHIVDTVSGYWSRDRSRSAMLRLLRRNPDFDGIFTGDDNMAAGAIEALSDAGWRSGVVITSATLFAEGYELIRQGKIYGSVVQSPHEDARMAIRVAERIVRGEEVPFYNFIDLKAVTRTNLHQVIKPDF